jgi:hypothetical protein
MLDRYEAQKARIDSIAGSLFPRCRVLYGNALKPEAIDGIHISDESETVRIGLLQETLDISALESLPDEDLVKAFRKSAEVHGYYR